MKNIAVITIILCSIYFVLSSLPRTPSALSRTVESQFSMLLGRSERTVVAQGFAGDMGRRGYVTYESDVDELKTSIIERVPRDCRQSREDLAVAKVSTLSDLERAVKSAKRYCPHLEEPSKLLNDAMKE